jgi:hypothetical protein
MPEKLLYGISISSGSQLLQSSMGILESGFSPVPLVTDSSGIAQLWLLISFRLASFEEISYFSGLKS